MTPMAARPVTALVEVEPAQPLGDYDRSLLDPLVTPFVESLRAVYHREAQRYLVRLRKQAAQQKARGETHASEADSTATRARGEKDDI